MTKKTKHRWGIESTTRLVLGNSNGRIPWHGARPIWQWGRKGDRSIWIPLGMQGVRSIARRHKTFKTTEGRNQTEEGRTKKTKHHNTSGDKSPLKMLGTALAAACARRFRGRLGAICTPARPPGCQGRDFVLKPGSSVGVACGKYPSFVVRWWSGMGLHRAVRAHREKYNVKRNKHGLLRSSATTQPHAPFLALPWDPLTRRIFHSFPGPSSLARQDLVSFAFFFACSRVWYVSLLVLFGLFRRRRQAIHGRRGRLAHTRTSEEAQKSREETKKRLAGTVMTTDPRRQIATPGLNDAGRGGGRGGLTQTTGCGEGLISCVRSTCKVLLGW